MKDGKTKEIKLKRKPKREDVKTEIKEQTVVSVHLHRTDQRLQNKAKLLVFNV